MKKLTALRILILLLAAPGALAGPRDPVAREKLRRPKARVAATLRATLAKNPSAGSPAGPVAGSLAELAGIRLSEQRDVVMLTYDPFLGDNIIYDYGKFTYLQEAAPRARIHYLSPTVDLLRESARIKPGRIPDVLTPAFFSEFRRDPGLLSRTLIEALREKIPAGAAVIWEDSTFRLLRGQLAERIAEAGLGTELLPRLDSELEKVRRDLIDRVRSARARGLGMDYSRGLTVVGAESAASAPGRVIRPGVRHLELEVGLITESRVYESAAHWNQLIFGQDAYLDWDPALHYDRRAVEAPFRDFMRRSQPSPGRPYIVLNLNTRGNNKVKDLSKDYGARLGELLGEMRDRHPGFDVFVAPAEAQYGEETVREVDRILARAQAAGGVHRMPVDRALWPPLLREAQAVVSQDSGFTHVAYLFNDQVLSISRDRWTGTWQGQRQFETGGSRRWSKPGQDYAWFGRVKPGQAAHASQVAGWLDRKLGGCGSRVTGEVQRAIAE